MILGLTSAAGTLVAAALLIRLHLLPTELNPIRDTVSDCGWTPFHRRYRAMVIVFGVSGALLALGLRADTDATSLYGCGYSQAAGSASPGS